LVLRYPTNDPFRGQPQFAASISRDIGDARDTDALNQMRWF
jgi:hypothetical protein